MTRRYDDPVHVRRRDEVPTEFLWRGRLYVVHDVLAHWVEVGTWWSGAAARALLGADDPSVPDAASAIGVDDREREVWRVEASAGRSRGSGVYDLRFDWSAGTWTLAQAID